jgi:hypothetical protein
MLCTIDHPQGDQLAAIPPMTAISRKLATSMQHRLRGWHSVADQQVELPQL